VSSTHATSATAQTLYREIPYIAFGILLNLVPAAVISALRLPVFVDASGTIVITLALGVRAGILTGVLSFLIGGITQNPVMPAFSGTQFAIAVYVHFMARRGWFRGVGRIIPTGVGLGILAAIVSAPVIVGLFGGLTGNGASLVVAFLLATGKSVMKSVILAGLAAEPLDKTLQCLIAYWLLKGMPKTVLAGLKKGSLRQNGFVA
jgi:energy-coupling factor transport system substrate-specific component